MKQYTRKEMRDIMEVRGFSQNTIKIYIDHLKNFAAYFNKAPHRLEPEHIHAYQVYLVQEKQVCLVRSFASCSAWRPTWSFFNQAVCALRFFLAMLSAMIGLSNISRSRKSTENCRLSYRELKSHHYYL